jgi:hypothetical protein
LLLRRIAALLRKLLGRDCRAAQGEVVAGNQQESGAIGIVAGRA